MKSKKRKIVTIIMVFVLSLSSSISVFASPSETNNPNYETNKKIAEKYDLNVDEVTHLKENLQRAIKKLPELNAGETARIKVSDNIYLETSVSAINTPIPNLNSSLLAENLAATRTTHRHTITAPLTLTNVFGATILTLYSVGVFSWNGSISTPEDAYGTYSALVWNVTNTGSSMSSPQYNAFVRNSFSGQLNIGIDPINMTIQSFSVANTINFNAAGSYSSSWN